MTCGVRRRGNLEEKVLGHEEIDELGALGGFTIHSGSRGEEVGFRRRGKKQRRSSGSRLL